jgi:O-acetyl-ADP-ribose deacetylase (regulator of RNase III)
MGQMTRELIRVHIGGKALEIKQGDITKEDVGAIVTAANPSLAIGRGVDGAIHHAAGRGVKQELREKYQDCPTGSAVVTGAGRLDADYVLHAVGPRYRGIPEDEKLLIGAYEACLRHCEELHIRSIAFPAISTGVYGYPLDEAAPLSLSAVASHLRQGKWPHLVRFVLMLDETFDAYAKALEQMLLK